MTTLLDPWNIIPLLMIFIASFIIPYLYVHMKGRRGPYSPALQGLVFFGFSLIITLILGSFWYLFLPFFPDPLLLLVLSRFLFPLPVMALAAVNWYRLFINPNPNWLAVTLIGLAVSAVGLAVLLFTYPPFIHGQPPLTCLLAALPFLALGLLLTAAGIGLWMKREQLLRIASPLTEEQAPPTEV